jgi:hypothetical protein
MPPQKYVYTGKVVPNVIIPASIGQQVFTITSGVAGGLAGLILATRLKKATHVNLQPLVLASFISAIATFGVVFMITEAENE